MRLSSGLRRTFIEDCSWHANVDGKPNPKRCCHLLASNYDNPNVSTKTLHTFYPVIWWDFSQRSRPTPTYVLRTVADVFFLDNDNPFKRYSVRKLRAAILIAVSFCVKRSRLALSRLRLTSASRLLSASLSFIWFSGDWVLSKWSLYCAKLTSSANMRLNIGRITAQWFCGGPYKSRLNNVAVKLENKFGCAARC